MGRNYRGYGIGRFWKRAERDRHGRAVATEIGRKEGVQGFANSFLRICVVQQV
jgi:hypothetical protein